MARLLTVAEAANLIGVKKRTLDNWRHTNRYDLPYIKSGFLVRYKKEDIDAFIESRRYTSKPALSHSNTQHVRCEHTQSLPLHH